MCTFLNEEKKEKLNLRERNHIVKFGCRDIYGRVSPSAPTLLHKFVRTPHQNWPPLMRCPPPPTEKLPPHQPLKKETLFTPSNEVIPIKNPKTANCH